MRDIPARRWGALIAKSPCTLRLQLPRQAEAVFSCCLSRMQKAPGFRREPTTRVLYRNTLIARSYCTLAVTDEFTFTVSLQVLVLAPPLEHAPSQIASRPLDTLSVTVVPGANCADPVLPVATLSPVGLEMTRSPLRPPAVTASDLVVGATKGFRVNVAERVTPPPETEMVTSVC